jgi:hypothetical protein
MIRYLIYTFFIVFGLSCAANKLSAKKFKSANTEYATDGIVFISFDFKKDNNSIKISYVESTQSAGTLKTQNENQQNSESKYLIQLQDEKGKALIDCYIANPFLEHKDVFSEDGSIKKGEVSFDQKIVSLRIQKLSKEIAKAAIFELSANSPQYITTLNCK